MKCKTGSRLLSTCALLVIMSMLGATDKKNGETPPDIIFIVLDDTGIDQWASFGWTEDLYQRAPDTPVLDAITEAGVKFTNCWAMPECSPSRTGMFTGRLPLRTGVEAAITTAHLPPSMANPSEIMIPK
ncbi:MAG: sulfatase-like hydrolase/transferase, partial [Planctomycetes bacterium]|nr:sulfatase-like hydrolase/transferase [Planctomycetota bacterium]